MVFAFILLCFNAILDSGCITHIIWDCQYFWFYNPSLAVLVGIVNCGTLNTLARDECHFWAHVDRKSVTLILSDCLHTSDLPINLLSVGSVMEQGIDVHFTQDATYSTGIWLWSITHKPLSLVMALAASSG